MKTDRDICMENLESESIADSFTVKPGGPNAKPLPKKAIFKTPQEKKIEERVKKLEDQMDKVITELRKLGSMKLLRKENINEDKD